MVVSVAAAAIVFFYSGTFFNWAGVKGLYLTFETWFKTGHERRRARETLELLARAHREV